MRAWLRRKVREGWKRLLALAGPPHAVALGFAVGVFFGFSPFWGLKTLLGVLGAWALRGNRVAAAVGVTAHDLYFPLVPVVIQLQYTVGRFLLGQPLGSWEEASWVTQLVESFEHGQWDVQAIHEVGLPVLLGATVLGLPLSALAYWLLRAALERAARLQRRGDEHSA